MNAINWPSEVHSLHLPHTERAFLLSGLLSGHSRVTMGSSLLQRTVGSSVLNGFIVHPQAVQTSVICVTVIIYYLQGYVLRRFWSFLGGESLGYAVRCCNVVRALGQLTESERKKKGKGRNGQRNKRWKEGKRNERMKRRGRDVRRTNRQMKEEK